MYRNSKIEPQDFITLDSLHFFCRSNDLAIRFGSGTVRDMVSPFGVVPQGDGDTLDVAQRLSDSRSFEILPMDQGKETCYFLTRQELEEQLRHMLN